MCIPGSELQPRSQPLIALQQGHTLCALLFVVIRNFILEIAFYIVNYNLFLNRTDLRLLINLLVIIKLATIYQYYDFSKFNDSSIIGG